MVGHEPLRDVARRALTDGSVEVGDQDPLELLFQFDGTLLIEEVGRLGKEQQGELLAGLESIEAHRTQNGKSPIFLESFARPRSRSTTQSYVANSAPTSFSDLPYSRLISSASAAQGRYRPARSRSDRGAFAQA